MAFDSTEEHDEALGMPADVALEPFEYGIRVLA
jgi:hypothetical protein